MNGGRAAVSIRRADHALAVAAQMRVLELGRVTLAVDGTKIRANAGRQSAVSHGRALAQIDLLERVGS